ncbi:hypothetical protein N8Z89_00485, partial [bacterium]|nr:hypothetical protein [bacterium]
MKKLLIFIIFMSFIIPFKALAGKKICESYLAKLRNIQSQQRAGYSNKKGQTLAEREKKARDHWWQCEQGKLSKKKGTKKVKKSKKKNKSLVKNMISSSYQSISIGRTLTNNVVIKAKFQGQQQKNWL